MPVSEIDDIFSGNSKSAPASSLPNSKKRKAPEDGQASTSATTIDSSESKKKKKKKKKEIAQNAPDGKAESKVGPSATGDTKKARIVETVLDTSSKLMKKSSKQDGLKGDAKSNRSRNKSNLMTSNEKDGLKKFQDSRGSEPRECKTIFSRAPSASIDRFAL